MGTNPSCTNNELNQKFFDGLFQWDPADDQLNRLLSFVLGNEHTDLSFEKTIEELRSLPAVLLRAKALEMLLRLNLIPSELSIFSPFAKDIVAKIAGYEYFSDLEEALEPPFSFPFTQDLSILGSLEEYFGVKSISQLVTGYEHKGLTVLVGETARKMERIVENEVANFPLDNQQIVILKANKREFPALKDSAKELNTVSIDQLNTSDSPNVLSLVALTKQELSVLDVENFNSSCVIISTTVSSAFGSRLSKVVDSLVSQDINVVLLTTEFDHALFTKAGHLVVFDVEDANNLRKIGVDSNDHRNFIRSEEGVKIRYTVLGGKGGPQMQIYPWIVNVKKQHKTVFGRMFSRILTGKTE